ncbi:MAG: hypothetical protein WC530_00920 [Candidatus Omnitrophota bacterium]
MRKIILAVVILSLLVSVPAFAQETEREELPFQGALGGASPAAGGGMMSSEAGFPTMITVPNGVIILAETKLLKYDYDLNLVKEVKIPMRSGDKQNPLAKKSPEKDALPVATQSQEVTTAAELQETTI